jgi:glycosyltransferase involved in cell wall biosynthesis
MKIIFISFEFAPLKIGGVFRPLAMAKYFSEMGVNTHVITLAPESYSLVYSNFSLDMDLEMIENENLRITRVPVSRFSLSKNRLKSFVDIYFSNHGSETKYWNTNAELKIRELIHVDKPDFILCTAPPFGTLKLAYKVAKEFKIPLVLDMRDAWSQWVMSPYGTYLHYLVRLFFEKKYLKFASLVVSTSEVTNTDFQYLHPTIDKHKFATILNGFDGKFENFSPSEIKKQAKIKIGYVGSFYFSPDARKSMLMPWYRKTGHRMLQYTPQKQDWLYRTPYFFFQTLKELKICAPLLFSKIEINFLGKKESWLEDFVSEFDLGNSVNFLGEKTRNESIDFQNSCDFLLITSSKRIGGKDYSIAGKTFEYIQLQKPIIAYVCEGAQKDLLAKTGLATIFNPDENNLNVSKMLKLLSGESNLNVNVEYCKNLSRLVQLDLFFKLLKPIDDE